MQLPGRLGLPMFGETSWKFYHDPPKFLQSHCAKAKSDVFTCRFFNRASVFVCSNDGVREVLESKEGVFELGHEKHIGKMLGRNVLMCPDEEARRYRTAIRKLMTPDMLVKYESILKRVMRYRLKILEPEKKFSVYPYFKETFLDMSTSVFLGIDCEEDSRLNERMKKLTLAIWQGLQAVPIDLKMPGMGFSRTAHNKGLNAKDKLLQFIDRQKNDASSGLPYRFKTKSGLDNNEINIHLLLFSCALLPKVLASVCTSVCIEAGKEDNLHWQRRAAEDERFLDCLICEAMRLYPPLFGGRRVTRHETQIAGYIIPRGNMVAYMLYKAHRDPKVFYNPDKFIPERWEDNPRLKDYLYTYGSGPRGCVGKELGALFLKVTLQGLFRDFTIHVPENQNLTRKYIPVSRPKNDVTAIVVKADSGSFRNLLPKRHRSQARRLLKLFVCFLLVSVLVGALIFVALNYDETLWIF